MFVEQFTLFNKWICLKTEYFNFALCKTQIDLKSILFDKTFTLKDILKQTTCFVFGY